VEIAGLRPYFKRWWWRVLLGAIGAALVAFGATRVMTEQYEASARLIVGPINADSASLAAGGQLTRTYAELASGRSAVAAAAGSVGMPTDSQSIDQIQRRITATPNDVSRLVTLRYQDTDPQRAADFTNALAERLRTFATNVSLTSTSSVDAFLDQQELLPLSAELRERIREAAIRTFVRPVAGRPNIVEAAEVPLGPKSPEVPLVVLFGAIAGALLTVGILVLSEQSTGAALGDDELARATNVPVLGTITRRTRTQPEPYRVIAAKIGLSAGEALRTLVVVDAPGTRQRTGIAACLAGALAETHSRVTLVDAYGDASTRTPSGPSSVGDRRSRRGERSAQGLKVVSLPVRGEGADHEPPATQLQGLRAEADVVVVSVPPVANVADSLVWADLADSVVLLVSDSVSSRREVVEASSSLTLVDAPLVGTVRFGSAPTFAEGLTLAEAVSEGARTTRRTVGDARASRVTPIGGDHQASRGASVGR
jgi:capsular polysaccharide biosynthesis protein